MDTLSKFDDVTWNVINAYFQENSLVKHQVESFNDFVLRKIDEIIEGFNPIEIQHQYIPDKDTFQYQLKINFSNPVLSKPVIYEKDGSTKIMTPNDARLRNFSYSSPLNVDVEITSLTYNETNGEFVTEVKKLNNINIGKIPIMVNSRYCAMTSVPTSDHLHVNKCKYDSGGYFIINGNEKVVVSQDRICENKTHVFTNNKQTAYSHMAEIRSVAENRFGVPKTTTLKLSSKANQFGRFIRASIHHIKHDIPLFILFKALGVESDKQILEYIVYNVETKEAEMIIRELVGTIDEASGINCARDALEYLSKYLQITGYPKEIINNKVHRLNIIRGILEKEFLPHVGSDFRKKALYLGYMVNKLIRCYLGIWEMDDRDSYINKRVDTPGVLLANLFRQYYGKMIKDMRNMIQKEVNHGSWKAVGKFINVINKVNIYKVIKSSVVESGLKYALATGNWGIKSNKNKQGVAQVLNRMTYNATLSHLRRINTPIEKTGKLIQPRKLHSTQWGYICPAECFDPDTPILSWDGIIKKAKDIKVDDYLVDDNGNAVRVKSTISGIKEMYEIIPKKTNFISYTVTDNHILTLKVRDYMGVRNHRGKKEFMWFDKKELKFRNKNFNNDMELDVFKSSIDDDNVIDITIEKYLSLPQNVQEKLYLFKSDGINWDSKEVDLDPYILGMWLGDGLSCGYGFVTADNELLGKWIEWGAGNDATITKGHKYKYHISSTINNTQTGISCNKTEKAPLKKLLAKYNLVKNKHIPLDYLVNDRKTRLSVLAGLIDTDGHVRANGHEIRICQGEKNYQIIYDAEFLARSLGFSCHVNDGTCTYTVNGERRQKPFKELTITGSNLFEIPTVLPRKKLNKFDNPLSEKKCSSYLQSSFKLVKKDAQPYVGWQVEGTGRFLLGDMSISHNTPEGQAVGLVKNMAMCCNITISSNSTNVREFLKEIDLVEFDGTNVCIFENATKVIVNGDILGVHNDPVFLYKQLKEMKTSGAINIYTGVAWNIIKNEININTEGGRCIRPLYGVKEGNKLQLEDYLKNGGFPRFNWHDIVRNSVVEYVDVEEQNFSLIASKPQDLVRGDKGTLKQPNYTHMEIHASMIMGVLAGIIPFSDHNQAPRNCYQCLDPNETVLMADGRYVPIKDVKVGDEVVTFDPKTMYTTTTKVIHQYVRPTENKVYEIETISGRKIIATGNHNFMTSEGWKAVESFDTTTKIGIMMNPIAVSNEVEDYLILDEQIFQKKLEEKGLNPTLITKHAKDLTKKGLLPLRSTHPYLYILARFVGVALSDGALNIYNKKHGGMTGQFQANFGTDFDARMFEDDVERVGFLKTQPIEQTRSIHGAINHTWKVSHNGSLPSLLLSLDPVVVGKKTETARNSLPEWIMNGSQKVKREFLSAFNGGDGCQIYFYNNGSSYSIYTSDTYQSIIRSAENSLTKFMEQYATLLEEFGVKVQWIKSRKAKKDEHVIVGCQIQNSYENLTKMFGSIGYCYTSTKSSKSGRAVEFIKYLSTHPPLKLTREEWLASIEIKHTSIFVPIKSIKEVSNRLISDITVEHDNHSFIAGSNFLSANSAMGKQAIGVYSTNYRHRFDTMAHVLNYPQRPIVQTNVSKIVHNNEMPCGVNVMIAIMTYTGYNQEDSVILNKSAVDRGLFSSTFYRTYKENCSKNHSNGEEEFFTHPDTKATKGIKPFNYDKLNDDGFVPENTYVDSNDIIIGKCMPQKVDSTITYKDTSISLKNNETGFVDRNCYGDKYFTNVNGDGYTFSKIRIRNTRVPTIGDKFSSRHGQKGTCGMQYRQEDMPFTKDGIVPDIIMNPHAVPSRMTIAQLMECLMGKACTALGTYGDATPFTDLTVEDLAEVVQSQGYERYGNEILYNPRTGEQINTIIFFGPTFYQRLKHMTADKQHSRGSNGPVVNLTRQPAEGRAREGGLRLGEMENSAMVSHGVGAFLKERFMETSDNYRVFVCKKCGMMANVNPDKNIYSCKACKNATHFSEIRIPYAAKLLFQEMQTMCVSTRFLT